MALIEGQPVATRDLGVDFVAFQAEIIDLAFDSWLLMSRPRGQDGRLASSVCCVALNQSASADYPLCSQATKSPNCLCRHHNKPGIRTIWNYDVFVAALAYGGFDELSQLLVGRQCDFWDFVADFAGICLGLFSYGVVVLVHQFLLFAGQRSKAGIAAR